jgi:hypothetical protein
VNAITITKKVDSYLEIQVSNIKQMVITEFNEQRDDYNREFLNYIPWIYLNGEVMKQCMSLGLEPIKSKKKGKKNKAVLFQYLWDHDKFKEICPQCPPVELEKEKICTSNTPFLPSTFGYKPYLDNDKEPPEVSNTLRFNCNKPLNREEFSIFKAFCEGWRMVLADLAFQCKDRLGENFRNLTRSSKPDVKDEKKYPTTYEDVFGKFSKFWRTGKGTYPDYIQFHLQTQTEDDSLGIKADAYRAFIDVWQHDTEGKHKLICTQLEKENSTAYSELDEQMKVKHILKKGDYCKVMWTFDHMHITEGFIGITPTAHAIRIATPEQLLGAEGIDMICPV